MGLGFVGCVCVGGGGLIILMVYFMCKVAPLDDLHQNLYMYICLQLNY